MRAAKDLSILVRAVTRRCGRLQRLVAQIVPGRVALSSLEKRRVAYVTIEAATMWRSFLRCFYLSCVFRARRMAGGRVSASASLAGLDEDGAVRHACEVTRGRPVRAGKLRPKFEPDWQAIRTILLLSERCNFSNLEQIRAGFGVPTKFHEDIPVWRNFFAHRGKAERRSVYNAAKKRRYNAALRPAAVLCERLPRRPQSILMDWLDDIRIVTEIMCQ